MIITNPDKIKLHPHPLKFIEAIKANDKHTLTYFNTESTSICLNWGGGHIIALEKISDKKWKIIKAPNQTIPEQEQTSISDHLKKSQYVETIKGWVKGFVMVHKIKKTYYIKHTINKSRGSRLYAKTYKETIKYFEHLNP